MQLVPLFIGAALLVFGRKLFWLFVGGVGFLVGVSIAARLFSEQSETSHLVIALGCGALGAIFAILVKKIAVGVAGFIAGGILFQHLVQSFSSSSEQNPWILFLVGGIIGAVLIVLLFEWALIVLSSLVGSLLIVQELHLPDIGTVILSVTLLACGILVQSRLKKQNSAREARDPN